MRSIIASVQKNLRGPPAWDDSVGKVIGAAMKSVSIALRAVSFSLCCALGAVGVDRSAANPRPIDEKPDPIAHSEAATKLARELDAATPAARAERIEKFITEGEQAIPALLLAKQASGNAETKTALSSAVDAALRKAAPKLDKFPADWAKEALAKRNWMAALHLATHAPEQFDLDARRQFIDALKELWTDARKENPALKNKRFPPATHDFWQRGEHVQRSSLNATVVARRYTPRSAIVNSVLLCDVFDCDAGAGVAHCIVICRSRIHSSTVRDSILITPRGIEMCGYDATLALTCGSVQQKARTYESIIGSFDEVDPKKLDSSETSVLLPKDMTRFWTRSSPVAVGVASPDAQGHLLVANPSELASKGGLQKGDTILEVNGRPVTSLGDLEAEMPNPKLCPIYVTVRRDKLVRVVSFDAVSSR